MDNIQKNYLKIFNFITKERIKSHVLYKTNITNLSEDEILNLFNQNKEKELILNRSLIGPHRDDLMFFFDDFNFKNIGSLGQMRIIGIVLKFIYIEYILQKTKDLPIVLLDDVLLELDEFHKNNVVEYLNMYDNLQTFECSTTKNLYKNLDIYNIISLEKYGKKI